MKFTLTVEQHSEVPSFDSRLISGDQAEALSKEYGIELRKDWQEKQYVEVSVPTRKSVSAVVFKQSFDELDLGGLVVLVNTPTKRRES